MNEQQQIAREAAEQFCSDVEAQSTLDGLKYASSRQVMFVKFLSAIERATAAEVQRREQVENALQTLIKAVQLKMFAGVPEIKTVDDLVVAMKTVSQKLIDVSEAEQLREQLLSALAVIEKLRNGIRDSHWHGKSLVELLAATESIDLSPLREHDAELKAQAELIGWHKGFDDCNKANEENKTRLIAEVRKPLMKALKILLDSAGCLAGEEPEIPEEISAQFDINLDDARKVHDALAKVKDL